MRNHEDITNMNEKINVLGEYTKEIKDIEVPPELDMRLNQKLAELRTRRRLPGIVKTSAASAAAITVIFAFLLMLSPDIRVFARELPVIGTIVDRFFYDESIEQAIILGSVKTSEFHDEKDGFILEVSDLVYDGLRLSMNAKLKGAKVNEILKDERKHHINFDADILSCDDHKNLLGYTMNTYKVREKDERYVYARVEKVFTEEELSNIQKGKEKFQIVFRYYGFESVYSTKNPFEKKNLQEGEFKLPVILKDFAGIKKEYKNLTHNFNNDFPANSLTVEKIISSPTLSQLVYNINMKEGINFLGLKNPYLIDGDGKKYKAESGQMRTLENESFIKQGKDEFISMGGGGSSSIVNSSGSSKLNITPSVYHTGKTFEKLCFDGICVSEEREVEINLKGSFPQKVKFSGREITINDARYFNGKLLLKMSGYQPIVEEVSVRDIDNRHKEGETRLQAKGNDLDIIKSYEVGLYDEASQKPKALEKKDSYRLKLFASYFVNQEMQIDLNK